VLFPELAVTGYPPEDLLLKEHFLRDARAALDRIAADAQGIVAVVGFPERALDVYNAAGVLAEGALQVTYRKVLLPNYGVFDEQRYFQAGARGGVIELDGLRVGLTVCEDVWEPGPPMSDEALAGATLILNISASPYHAGKGAQREQMFAQRARDAVAAFAYCNLVGGQDELVFDGASLVFDEHGVLIARAKQFVPDLLVVDIDVRPAFHKRQLDPRGRVEAVRLPEIPVSEPRLPDPRIAARIEPTFAPVHEVYEALVLGTRDYVRKNGFAKVVIGLSGGIDSALVAAIAVDALGADNVAGVLMPSRYSSDHSVTDARAVATNLGIRSFTVPIEPAHAAFESMLGSMFENTDPGLAEENVQARIRGNVLMTISNKFGWMVLTTGNKSEMATGYATLYGDMAGGFAVIKDVPKTLVYALCNDLNERAGREVIPRAVIDKPPSAELAPDQLDSDSLPPYDVLDPIVAGYVEDDLSVAELIERGHDADLTQRVARMVDRNEYKRRQAAPGVRVSPKAFGKDRRLPITNRWPG
jgi:NAD+ synthase (glutamine-hydrolysing)